MDKVVRCVGDPWSVQAHIVKEFLGRNNVPFIWEEGEELSLTFPSGEVVTVPNLREIAKCAGFNTQPKVEEYDLVVIGAGPGGLAAAVYGASEGLQTLVVERHSCGGQAGMSSRIENYLGFPIGLTGSELAIRATQQAERLGAEIALTQEAVRCVEKEGGWYLLTFEDGCEVRAWSVIIATGVDYRTLEAEGVKELHGRGVYYGAAMNEGPMMRGGEVFIVGGANSAGQAAMYFSTEAARVVMLVRGDGLSATMSQYLVDQIAAVPNIEVWAHVKVIGAKGDQRLKYLDLAHGNRQRVVPADGLFIFIGATPRTDWLEALVTRDERGFVVTGEEGVGPLETSCSGVFAVGDVRAGSVKRVAAAVGEGSTAVMFVHLHLAKVR